MLTPFDHAFVVLFAVAYPVFAFFSYRRILRRVAIGEKIERTGIFVSAVAGHWILFAAGAVLWYATNRPFDWLGFTATAGWPVYVGVIVVAAITILLWMQATRIREADSAAVEKLAGRFGDVRFILPTTPRELWYFRGVSISAGIVEEILWRGFLFWYLGMYLSPWLAAVLSAILFGLAHSYQGWRQVPAVVGVGAAFSLLYLLTGSIWLVIVFHAAFDIVQGQLAYEVISRRRNAGSPRTGA